MTVSRKTLVASTLIIIGLIGAAHAESVMKQCGDEWKAAKANNTTNGQTWQEFLKSCRAQTEAAAHCEPVYRKLCKGFRSGPEMLGSCYAERPSILGRIPQQCVEDFQTTIENYNEAKGQQ
jgi:hypothetical protein